jgi:hypothetical protein
MNPLIHDRRLLLIYNAGMSYELWDTETRNIIETFESEEDALQAARELVAVNATVYPGALALVFENDAGESTLIARGTGLASRARLVR